MSQASFLCRLPYLNVFIVFTAHSREKQSKCHLSSDPWNLQPRPWFMFCGEAMTTVNITRDILHRQIRVSKQMPERPTSSTYLWLDKVFLIYRNDLGGASPEKDPKRRIVYIFCKCYWKCTKVWWRLWFVSSGQESIGLPKVLSCDWPLHQETRTGGWASGQWQQSVCVCVRM